MSRARVTVDARIVRLFIKTVGVGLGFYIPSTRTFSDGLESDPLYQANLEIVRTALKSGWTASELEAFVCERYRAGEKVALLSDILPKKSAAQKLGEDENLLEPGIPYQHPRLYIQEPPVFDMTIEGLALVRHGAVRCKETFTLSDLACYYFDMTELPATEGWRETTLGALRWLLKQARVDEILTTIDLAVDVAPPVVKLADWLDEARQIVRDKEGRVQ